MNKDQVSKLRHGCYILYWKGGGCSYSVVGSLHNGQRWYACANWTSATSDGIVSVNWRRVSRAEQLAA